MLASDAGQAVESAVPVAGEASLPSCQANGLEVGNIGLCKANSGEVHPGKQILSQATTMADIIFVDSRVDDVSVLSGDLREGAEFVLIDADCDAIKRISEHLSNRRDVRSVHIVSHGMAGELVLGSQRVDTAHLELNKRQISGWSRSLSRGADIFVYGCEAGRGIRGESFVRRLAFLSGADVAASIDRTGNGGQADWEFELHVGSIESTVVFSSLTQQKYCGTLALTGKQFPEAAAGPAFQRPSFALTNETDLAIDEPGFDFDSPVEPVNPRLPVDEIDSLPTEVSIVATEQTVANAEEILPPVKEISSSVSAVDVELPLEEAALPLELEPIVVAPQSAELPSVISALTEQASPILEPPVIERAPAGIEASTSLEVVAAPLPSSELAGPMSLGAVSLGPVSSESVSSGPASSGAMSLRPVSSGAMSLGAVSDARQEMRSLSRPLVISMTQSAQSGFERGSLSTTMGTALLELQPIVRDAIPNSGEEFESRSQRFNVIEVIAKSEPVSSAAVLLTRVKSSGGVADSQLDDEADQGTDEMLAELREVRGEVAWDELHHASFSEVGLGSIQDSDPDEAFSSRGGAYWAWANQNGVHSDPSAATENLAESDQPFWFIELAKNDSEPFGQTAMRDFASANEKQLAKAGALSGQIETQPELQQRDFDPSEARLSNENTLPITTTVSSLGMDAPSPALLPVVQSTAQVHDRTLDTSAELLEAFAQPTRLVCRTDGADLHAPQLTMSYLNPLKPYQAVH